MFEKAKGLFKLNATAGRRETRTQPLNMRFINLLHGLSAGRPYFIYRVRSENRLFREVKVWEKVTKEDFDETESGDYVVSCWNSVIDGGTPDDWLTYPLFCRINTSDDLGLRATHLKSIVSLLTTSPQINADDIQLVKSIL